MTALAARARRRIWGIVQQALLHLPARRAAVRPTTNVIVSLTSFPARIDSVWLTLESILRQRAQPERIVLVLAEDEFPGRTLPKSITSRPVEILWTTRNTRSYKKLLPTAAAYPDAVIITADDDVLYPRWWLTRLLEGHAERPTTILGLRGTVVTRRNEQITPYVEWPAATRLSRNPVLKGDAGILYPAGSVSPLMADIESAMRICPSTDDLWFWATAQASGTVTWRITDRPIDFPTMQRSQRTSLRSVNVDGGGNDTQFRLVTEHLGLTPDDFAAVVEPASPH